jgi:MoxR-like ATPase
LGLGFKRIQGSPDILPADIVGTHVLEPKTGSFRLEKGPIFSNILLIDEINRNTPKTNSAVLEAMQVLIDRFLLSVKVDYPSVQEEIEITDRMYSIDSSGIKQVMTSELISYLIDLTKDVYVAPQVRSYIVGLVHRTRNMDEISLGTSLRASIALSKSSRARALIKGRMYVLPNDIKYLAARVLRHRIVRSAPGRNQQLSAETIVGSILEETPIPKRPT